MISGVPFLEVEVSARRNGKASWYRREQLALDICTALAHALESA